MSIKSIEKIDNEFHYEYFSYFNYKLYDSPIFTQEEKDIKISELNRQSTEETLSNDLSQNINELNIEDKFIPLNLLELSPSKEPLVNTEEKSSNKDIKPELHKFILPKSLFNSDKNKSSKREEVNKQTLINEKNNTSNDILLDENSFLNHLNLLSQPFVPKNKLFSSLLINTNDCLFNVKASKNVNKKGEKKKKNSFVKREGDWICCKCKNLNFAFRKICNKCKLPKEESEKQIFDIGKELMKLADLSILNK